MTIEEVSAAAPVVPQTSTWRPVPPNRFGTAPLVVLIAGLAIVALALRLFLLGKESFWLDEGYTLFFSQLPLKQLILIGGAHEHPPLYYLLVHTALTLHRWFLATRLISAVSGSLAVVLLYLLGREMFGRNAGVAAAALLVVSPFQVWWSRDGRAYELAGLLVLASYLSLYRALGSGRGYWWCAYSLTTALALYTEYTTILVLVPEALFVTRARERSSLRPLLVAWCGTFLLFAPWLGFLARDTASIATDYWIPAPTWSIVQNTVLEFLGLITPCPNFPCSGPEAPLPLVFGHEELVVILGVIAALAALAFAVARRRFDLMVASLWLVLPFALVLALSERRSLYVDRVFLDATFGLYLVIGAVVGTTHRRLARLGGAILAVCMVLGAIANVRLVYATLSNPDFRSLARDLQTGYRPGQVVVYNPGVLRSLVQAYTSPGWRPTREQPLWFHAYLDIPHWQKRFAAAQERMLNDPRTLPQLRYGRYDTFLRDQQLGTAIHGTRQLWLVTQDYGGLTDNRRWLQNHGFTLLLSEIYVGDSRLELWDRLPPARFGPAVMPAGWTRPWAKQGQVEVRGQAASEMGVAALRRSVSIHAGGTYAVNVEFRAAPGSRPSVALFALDRRGRVLGTIDDRYGDHLDSFPRTEWYDMPANGVWLSQPFGFVAPPGTVRGVLVLRTDGGTCSWRNIAIYREAGTGRVR